MKNSCFIFIGILMVLASLGRKTWAQDKEWTLQDLIPGGNNYFRFTPRDLKQLQWCGDFYVYAKGDSLLGALPTDGSEKVVLNLEQLNQLLAEKKISGLGSLPVFTVPSLHKPVLAFQHKNQVIHYDLVLKQVVATYSMESGWDNQEYCEANGYLAFTEKNNVYVITPENKKHTITNETDLGIVCGTSVHQNEFGIHKGLYWSPKGTALAFYRMDERMVTEYPLVNMGTRIAKAEPFKYPMAGMKSHEVSIGIYRFHDNQTIWLQTGLPKEKYLTNIAWSPDEKSIYVAELNRDQNECKLVRYSTITGEKEGELFTEKNERYVEPQNPILFVPNQPERFIWQSQRDGFNHLYLYDTNGKFIKQLTSGKWMVTKVYGLDEKGQHLFFASTAIPSSNQSVVAQALNVHTWKLNLKTGESVCLNTEPGLHQAKLNYAGSFAIEQTMSPSIPRNIDLIQVNPMKTAKRLLEAKNPLEKYVMPTIKTGVLLSADGKTELNYRLVVPSDLDVTKKYPAIVYVYGGPHLQLVTGGWLNGANGWDLYMAQKGYILLTLDNRGSANRGFEFESVIHRQLGVHEMADQLEGVKFLQSIPYVDSDRMGVHGWSYGGFMTTNLLLTYPEVFKVGVAGGPVIDWERYEIMYGERYMDHPKDNSEGYSASNLCHKAASLKGKLLVIHGDMDPVVVWQHSLLFLKSCVDHGTFPDYFVYPGHKHNVIGKDRPHLYEKITRYFEEHL